MEGPYTDSIQGKRAPIKHLEEARAAAGPALDRLHSIYGDVHLPVVYFVQRDPAGPVKIGHTSRLAPRLSHFFNASQDPVIVRAVVIGTRAHEHWFHKRNQTRWTGGEWYEPVEEVVADARRFGDIQAASFTERGGWRDATLAALRELDPWLADIERLRDNGFAYAKIRAMSGMSPGRLRSTVEHMRALGFRIPPTRVYASRTPRFEAADFPRRTRFIT